MEAREYRVDQVIILELKGRVDEFNTAVLCDEIHTIINTGRSCIGVDLGLTDFVSAHCLSAIWRCQQRAKRYQGDIVLFGARGKCAETIAYVSLGKVMTVVHDLDAVRDHFKRLSNQDLKSTSAFPQGIHKGWQHTLRRFFQLVLLFGFGLPLALFLPAPRFALADSSQADSVHVGQVLDRKTLRELVARHGAMAQLTSLRMQERLQDRDIARSLQLPSLMLTSGYLHQSNPNLLTQIANRELNQLRRRSDNAEYSELQTNSSFRIDNDVVIVSLGVVQVLYSGGLYQAQMRLADAQIKEGQAKALVDEGIALETADKLYWGIVLGERKVKLLASRRDAAAAQSQAKERSAATRAISRSEAAESELALLAAEQALLEAEQDLAKAKETLNTLLGRQPHHPLVLAPEEPTRLSKVHEPEDYLAIAEHRYADMAHAAARVDTARAYEASVAASAVRSPKAFALGAVDHTQGLGDDQRILNWSAGFAITLPLYDGGRSFAETEKSRLLLAQARLGYDEARRKLHLAIREAVAGLRAAAIKLTIAEKARSLAKERARAAEQAAASGQIPQHSLLLVTQAGLEADVALVAAQSEYAAWRSRLEALTGEQPT